LFVTVALRNLAKNSSNDKVCEKAEGALWILENRDQEQSEPTPTKRGSYMIVQCSSELKDDNWH